MMNRAALLAAVLALGPVGTLPAQQEQQPPPANPADVSSPEAIVRALYEVISGDSGVARNWDRFRSLFAPGARMIPIRPAAGGLAARPLSVDDYIRSSGPVLERGFNEREIARRSESYGQLVHVFSTYEARRRAADAQPFMRGMNSFQLFSDGQRWWVMNVMWLAETPQNPLPTRYLTGERD